MTTPKTHNQKPLTYKDAGVDIDAGNDLVDDIKPAVAKTWRPGVLGNVGIGKFGGRFSLEQAGYPGAPDLIAGTDGVGTKILLAIKANNSTTIGTDLVAMCVNDLLRQGAEPMFFLNYFATGKLDGKTANTVIKSIAQGCEAARCGLIGGETAEMPDMYAEGHYDLAGFALGVAKYDVSGEAVQRGDVVLGLPSSGIHSNGISLLRRVIAKEQIDLQAPLPGFDGRTAAETFLTPTRIYVREMLAAMATGKVKAVSHITGGGWVEKPIKMVPNQDLALDFDARTMPAVFRWIQAHGPVEHHEMYRTFNCGIGMMAVTAPEDADAVKAAIREAGGKVLDEPIGQVISRHTDQRVYLPNAER
jgi:phosphoribosylformylglycinamidine cyclo-ligase